MSDNKDIRKCVNCNFIKKNEHCIATYTCSYRYDPINPGDKADDCANFRNGVTGDSK